MVINPVILVCFTTNQDFRFGALSAEILFPNTEGGNSPCFFSCFGKEEREYMAGCVLQAGISGGKIGATAGQRERMPCHVPCKEIRLRLQPGLSKN